MSHRLHVTAMLVLSLGASRTVGAQRLAPRKREFWVAGTLSLAAVIPFDERIREYFSGTHTALLDHVATPVGDAGSPRFILPVLLAGAIVPRLLRDPATSNAVVDIGLGYVVTSVSGALARTVVGRHRPDSTGHTGRFSPFRREPAWHSFPSGHVLGVMSLATGIAIKSNRPWVTTTTFGLASLVAIQRLYEQKHWASDVVAGTMFGIAASASTIRWRERERARPD